MVQDYIWEHGRPDLIHLHVAMNGGMVALQLKRTTGIPRLQSIQLFIIQLRPTGWKAVSFCGERS